MRYTCFVAGFCLLRFGAAVKTGPDTIQGEHHVGLSNSHGLHQHIALSRRTVSKANLAKDQVNVSGGNTASSSTQSSSKSGGHESSSRAHAETSLTKSRKSVSTIGSGASISGNTRLLGQPQSSQRSMLTGRRNSYSAGMGPSSAAMRRTRTSPRRERSPSPSGIIGGDDHSVVVAAGGPAHISVGAGQAVHKSHFVPARQTKVLTLNSKHEIDAQGQAYEGGFVNTFSKGGITVGEVMTDHGGSGFIHNWRDGDRTEHPVGSHKYHEVYNGPDKPIPNRQPKQMDFASIAGVANAGSAASYVYKADIGNESEVYQKYGY